MAMKNKSYTPHFVRRSRRIIRHVEPGLAQSVEAVADDFVRRIELAILGPCVVTKVGIERQQLVDRFAPFIGPAQLPVRCGELDLGRREGAVNGNRAIWRR